MTPDISGSLIGSLDIAAAVTVLAGSLPRDGHQSGVHGLDLATVGNPEAVGLSFEVTGDPGCLAGRRPERAAAVRGDLAVVGMKVDSALGVP